MIEIKKAEDISEQEFENKLEVYALKLDNNPVLYCAYKIENDRVEIYDIKGDLSDALFIDAIVRAVASYAQGKGANTVDCRNDGIYKYLLALGFEKDVSETKITASSEFLLRHRCCMEE